MSKKSLEIVKIGHISVRFFVACKVLLRLLGCFPFPRWGSAQNPQQPWEPGAAGILGSAGELLYSFLFIPKPDEVFFKTCPKIKISTD